MNELTSYVGSPKVLVTDRGTAFTSREFQRYCMDNNIQHRLNAVRTPRANGQVERMNRTILTMVTTMTEEDKTWDENLRDIQWSLNTMKNSVTGRSPQELLYSFKPRDVLQNKLIAALQENQMVSDEELQVRREIAARRINENRAKVKERSKANRKKPNYFEVGDLVLVENEMPSIGQSRKLEPKFKGPYMVTKALGKDRYVIEDLPHSRRTKKQYSSVFAADKMKHWCNVFDDSLEDTQDEPEDDLSDDEVDEGATV